MAELSIILWRTSSFGQCHLTIPVNSIAHFYHDKRRKSHCHWLRMVEYFAVYFREHPWLSNTMWVVTLYTWKHKGDIWLKTWTLSNIQRSHLRWNKGTIFWKLEPRKLYWYGSNLSGNFYSCLLRKSWKCGWIGSKRGVFKLVLNCVKLTYEANALENLYYYLDWRRRLKVDYLKWHNLGKMLRFVKSRIKSKYDGNKKIN